MLFVLTTLPYTVFKIFFLLFSFEKSLLLLVKKNNVKNGQFRKKERLLTPPPEYALVHHHREQLSSNISEGKVIVENGHVFVGGVGIDEVLHLFLAGGG